MNELQVKKLLEENKLTWRKFKEWMYGQTYAMIDGEPDYYEWDVERFVRNQRCRCDCRFAPVKHSKCECACHVRT